MRPRSNKLHRSIRKKKKCELGSECPYKNEYQHQMEFSHDLIAPTSLKSTPASNFRPFSGVGETMSSSSSNNGKISHSVSALIRPETDSISETIDLCDVLSPVLKSQDNVDCGKPMPKVSYSSRKKSVNFGSVIDLCDGDDDNENKGDDECVHVKRPADAVPSMVKRSRHRVDLSVPSASWITEMPEVEEQRQLEQAIAASNRDIISDQDAEYYQSLMEDQSKDRAKRQMYDQIREEEELRLILEESAKTAEEERKRSVARQLLNLQNNLEPEPPEGQGVATIAFRLPSQCSIPRLVRRFPVQACADQLVSFLKSRKELIDIPSWSLRTVVGGKDILSSSSLLDLGLAPRGVVMVHNEGD